MSPFLTYKGIRLAEHRKTWKEARLDWEVTEPPPTPGTQGSSWPRPLGSTPLLFSVCLPKQWQRSMGKLQTEKAQGRPPRWSTPLYPWSYEYTFPIFLTQNQDEPFTMAYHFSLSFNVQACSTGAERTIALHPHSPSSALLLSGFL